MVGFDKAPGLLRPLRERDFALLWAGMSVSLLGDGFYNVAIAWQVYQIANAPAALGAVGASFTLPRAILLLFGGVLSDRYDRRRLMLAGNLAGCLSIAGLGVLSLSGQLQLWHVFGLVAVYGVGTAIFLPAFGAVVPQLLPSDLLPNANALDQFVRHLSLRLVGPALGGLVVALAGSGWAFIVDAASFVFAAATVAVMRTESRPSPSARQAGLGHIGREMTDGLRYVVRTPWLWATMFFAGTISTTLLFGPA
jgi:MFS family permease